MSNYGNNTIEEFNSSGVGTVFANSGLSGPQGIAFDNNGNLYVANSGNNTIEKFNSQGVGTLFAYLGVNNPQGLAFYGGNLYVANNWGGNIEEFNSIGASTIFASNLTFPDSLAFDNSGNLYAGTIVNNSPVIQKFSPSGSSYKFYISFDLCKRTDI